MEFEDFSIQFDPGNRDRSINVSVESPGGQGHGVFCIPELSIDPRELECASSVPFEGPEQAMGEQLFNTLFVDDVLGLYRESLGKVSSVGRGLRIKFKYDPSRSSLSKIHALPWELLFWPERKIFLGLGADSPIVRMLQVSGSLNDAPLAAAPRVLVAAANTLEWPALRLRSEADKIEKTGVEVHILEHATVWSLHEALQDEINVLHFMGHGQFDPTTGEGALIFDRGQGCPDTVSGKELIHLIKDCRNLRLVFLNACETARVQEEHGRQAFAGVASALALGGLPAVVAMQRPIEDRLAALFSATFYEKLAAGLPIDVAVSEGRMQLFSIAKKSVDWATPVLFLRAANGALFDAEPASAPHTPKIQLLKGEIAGLPVVPFPGLFPYTHPALFGGRERELARLRQDVLPTPILGLHATSGAGKSSLLVAGLIPRLRREGYPVAYANEPHVGDLAEQLINRLLETATEGNGKLVVGEGWDSFVELLGEARELAGGRTPILILDQFEHLLNSPNQKTLAIVGCLMAATVKQETVQGKPLCRWLLSYRRDRHGDVVAWLRNVSKNAPETEPWELHGLPYDLSNSTCFHDWPLDVIGTASGPDKAEQIAHVFWEIVEKPLRLRGANGRPQYALQFSQDGAERLVQALVDYRLEHPEAPLLPALQVLLSHLRDDSALEHGEVRIQVPEDLHQKIDDALVDHLRRALDKIVPRRTENQRHTSRERTFFLMTLGELARKQRETGEGFSRERLAASLSETPPAEALEKLQEQRLVVESDREGEIIYLISHDRMVDVILRMTQEEAHRKRLSVNEELWRLRRLVSVNSELYSYGEEEQALRLVGRQYRQIEAYKDALIGKNPEINLWWQASQAHRQSYRRRLGTRIALSTSLVLISLLFVFNLWQGSEKARLQNQVKNDEPGAALAAIQVLQQRFDLEPLELAELIESRKSHLDIFEVGPSALAPESRSRAVLAAAQAVMPVLVAKDDLVLIGMVSWALDYFPHREEGFRQEARDLRAALLAPLRSRRSRSPLLEPSSWVSVPGGTFRMGDSEPASANGMSRSVIVSPFQIMSHEVTNAEFRRFDPAYRPNDQGNLPASAVNWYLAYGFSAWLGGRLPTEAEWEYAARAGCRQQVDYCDAQGREVPIADMAWYRGRPSDSGIDGLQEVMRLEPNAWGLYDVFGNAWEWVADWHGPFERGDRLNPWGPPMGSEGKRVRRGGWWHSYREELLPGYRAAEAAGKLVGHQSFRVVMPIENDSMG